MTYNSTHRFFLRTIAHHGVLSMTQSKQLIQDFTGQNDISSIKYLIEEINDKIAPLKQRIAIVKDRNTENCEETLIFMMITADNTTKAQKIFVEKELNYFRKLIEEIISTDCRVLESYTALNLAKSPLTKKEAEVLLDRWCKMHYLKKITNITHTQRKQSNANKESIKYTLGLRGIYEFETYFTQYLQVEKCMQCKEIVITGCNCTVCHVTLHKPCSELHMVKKHPHVRTSLSSGEDILMESEPDGSCVNTDEESEYLRSDNSDYDTNPPPKKRKIRAIYEDDEDL